MAYPWNPDKAFGLPSSSMRAIFTGQLLFGWQLAIFSGIALPEEYLYFTYAALIAYFGKDIISNLFSNFVSTKAPQPTIIVTKDNKEDKENA